MFKLTIETGNDAMQHPEDVAYALRAVAQRLTEAGSWLTAAASGNIRDKNGNLVGEFGLEDD